MSTPAVTTLPVQPSSPQQAVAGQRRKSRRQGVEGVRYFLAKDGSSIEKPELGVEVASEGEALVKAFQTKNGVIYRSHVQSRSGVRERSSDIGQTAPAQVGTRGQHGFKEETHLQDGSCRLL